ncbi:hypothetical protein [Streptomyces sp. NPDC087787]|uniref:hypothetical protein n=1 Tax=Streptomyces sp. NPDC087787 TaxID=3365803 RepID=UPI003812613D
MSPRADSGDSTAAVAIAELREAVRSLNATVDTLAATVAAQGKQLSIVYTAAALVVGIIGGPNAVHLFAQLHGAG